MLRPELDSLVFVVVDVIIHAHFERINAVGRCNIEILSLQCAEETYDHRVVEVVAPMAHALLYAATREDRSVGLHLLAPASVRVCDQFGGAHGLRKCFFDLAGDQHKDRTCHAWLRDNDLSYLPWLGLDDRSWLYRPFCKTLFLVNGKTGLTWDVAEQLAMKMRHLIWNLAFQ